MTLQQWKFFAVAAAIVLFAFLARSYRIGNEELWQDETFSFYMINWSKWPKNLLIDNNPPLYYLLLWVWAKAFGQSEAALRMLSASFGTLFVVTLIW